MLANIRVPAFLQFAEKDRLFEPRYGDWDTMQLTSSPSVTVDVVARAGHTFMLAPEGPAATQRMIDWLRSRPEAPACG